MNIALVQINTVVGDVAYNLELAKKNISYAVERGAELILLPELVLTGYPPRDLLFREDFINQNLKAKQELVSFTGTFKSIQFLSAARPTIVFGYVDRTDKDGCKPLYNAACVAREGKVIQTRFKTLLPTYDVFEEYRYFEPGPREFEPFELDGKMVGVIICEEAWNDKKFWQNHLYDVDPVAEMVRSGATVIACINSSPYRNGIEETRRNMIAQHCKTHNVAFAYVNQTGYNDEVGFDGNSFLMNTNGEVIQFGMPFREEVILSSTDVAPIVPDYVFDFPWQENVLLALETGVKDYFSKLGIKGPAIIGLSGGIDSALVAYIAARALGKDRVIGVGMPSEFSSEGSVSDAEKIAKTLGIKFAVQPIKQPHNEIREAVDAANIKLYEPNLNHNTQKSTVELFGRGFAACKDAGVTDENIQARIRGIYLMALSNYYNGLVLSTGNKSEMAVGYCTLYGDMCGGLAVISDVLKTTVFELCRYINDNTRTEIIPWNTINKKPSAELRAGQFDEQTLPPYETLDAVVFKYVDEGKSPARILDEMVNEQTYQEYLKDTNRDLEKDILWVCSAIVRNEFKRKQSPTGLKISQKHFKYGWNQPIVHRLPVII